MDNVIETYRKRHKCTYASIADKVGLSAGAVVYAHCHNLRRISAESAIKYSQALNIPLSELRPDLWAAGESVPQPPSSMEGEVPSGEEKKE